MLRKLMMSLSLVCGALALSACGSDVVGITDSPSSQGALEEGADTLEVDADCLEQCIDKGETEDDCNVWCSEDKGEESSADCLAECVDKGESEEDCSLWCSEDKDEAELDKCLDECIEKGETEEDCIQWCDEIKDEQWDDKDGCDGDKDNWGDYDDK